MNMAQYIIISIILGVVVFYIGLRIYNLLTQKSNVCEGCTGCAGSSHGGEKTCSSRKK